METLEQYGIKDVTPGKSVGSSERLRGEFRQHRYILNIFKGDEFRGILFGASYDGNDIGGQGSYSNDHGGIWLDEVSYK